MKLVLISGSMVGNKTKTALQAVEKRLNTSYPDVEIEVIDLAQLTIQFSDGRPYFEYTGDTLVLTETLMEADGIVIGTPTYQASIPAPLKNTFDLLPIYALRDKTVGVIVTAGSSKHYLMVEQQLKPILTYMKAKVLSDYVFIEEHDIDNHGIANYDIDVRINRLVEQMVYGIELQQQLTKKLEDSFEF